MKKTFIFFTLLAFFFAVTSATALATPNLQAFAIDSVGTSVLPAGMHFANAVGTEEMKNMEIQYDLTGTDKDISHYARLIIYKDPHDLGPTLSFIDLVEFKPELVTLMSNTGKNLVSQKMEEQGAKLIEWLPANKALINKHNGIQLGARFTLSKKLPLPMYATVAVYPQDGKLTGIALICPDTDREYWQTVYTQIINNIK